MPRYQLCSCYVALANDPEQVVHRGAERPVTLPEIEILNRIHGNETGYYPVSDVEIVGYTVPRTDQQERQRLIEIYGSTAVHEAFPDTVRPLPFYDTGLPAGLGLTEALTMEECQGEPLVQRRYSRRRVEMPVYEDPGLDPATANQIPPPFDEDEAPDLAAAVFPNKGKPPESRGMKTPVASPGAGLKRAVSGMTPGAAPASRED